eukprot:GHVS01050230.1.p1 GENE.GHVS01050230.1~~GHVS01050230.1.p1  ORF type:complete len:436 (+),score=15.85 GHVS01050230.1:110-1417(+)
MELDVNSLQIDWQLLEHLLCSSSSGSSLATASRVKCHQCGKSRRFWCSQCSLPLSIRATANPATEVSNTEEPEIQSECISAGGHNAPSKTLGGTDVYYPRISSLPFTFHIVRHIAESHKKSTATPLGVICPSHVRLYTFIPGVDDSIPDFSCLTPTSLEGGGQEQVKNASINEPAEEKQSSRYEYERCVNGQSAGNTILLFPLDIHPNIKDNSSHSDDRQVSGLFRQLVLDSYPIDNVVILDCTWHQTLCMLQHKHIRKLRRAQICGYKSVVWRYNTNKTKAVQLLQETSRAMDSATAGSADPTCDIVESSGKVGVPSEPKVCTAECVYYVLREYVVARRLREANWHHSGPLSSTHEPNCIGGNDESDGALTTSKWLELTKRLYNGEYDNILFFFVLVYKRIQVAVNERDVSSGGRERKRYSACLAPFRDAIKQF